MAAAVPDPNTPDDPDEVPTGATDVPADADVAAPADAPAEEPTASEPPPPPTAPPPPPAAPAPPAAPPAPPEAPPAPPADAVPADAADAPAYPAAPVEEQAPAAPIAPPYPPASDAAAADAAQQVVYVHAPVPPKLAGNRGVGTLLAILGAIVYGVLLAGAYWAIQYFTTGGTGVGYLATWDFYAPIAVFAIAFVVLVLLVNRAGWGAYVFGSLIVGLVVYAGTIGVYVAANWIIFKQIDYFDTFAGTAALIIAGILAREVAVWFGAIIARRGKRLTVRNAEARADFDKRLAEFHAGSY